MNNIPLNLLESFLVFSASKNMREAADNLKISQPALSFQLKLLQDKVPHKLFMLKGKKKVLTSYGQEILESFRAQIISIHYSIESVNNKYKSTKEMTIKISGRLELLRKIVNNVNFEGNIHFISRDGNQVIQDLIDRKIDIAISTVKPDSLLIHAKALLKDNFCFLIPKKWEISYKESHDLIQKLKNRPYIGYNEKISAKLIFLEGIKAHRSIEDWQQIVSLVDAGVGWSIIPTSFSRFHNNCETAIIRGTHFPENQFYLLYSKENSKYNWFKKLIDEIIYLFQIP